MRENHLTIDEAASLLRVSRDWVAKACRRGVLPHVAVGGPIRCRRLVPRAAVDEYLRRQTRAATDRAAAMSRPARLAAVPEVY